MVEDADAPSATVERLLQRCGVPYTYIHRRTPQEHRRRLCTKIDPRHGCPHGSLGKEEESWKHPRGVEQRNAGLEVLRAMYAADTKTRKVGGGVGGGKEEETVTTNLDEGVLYFADDDNTYALELFDLIRQTTRVAVWRVGLSGDMRYEGPKVDAMSGLVNGWHVGWRPERAYPVDMAGFAVANREILARPNLRFDGRAPRGNLESYFLREIVDDKSELEPLGMAMDRVFVWHTQTKSTDLKWEHKVPSDPGVTV